MQGRSRRFLEPTRRGLFVFGAGALAAAALPTPGDAQVLSAETQQPEQPDFSERMVRSHHRPVTTSHSILDRSGRVPCVLVMDDDGNWLHGRLHYDGAPYSQPGAGVDPNNTDPEWIAAQYQFTASTTKVVALLAAIEWIKEQAAAGPHPQDAMPADALLHPGLQPYARVLGRPVSLTPRINTGGIMFHSHPNLDRRGTVNSLTIDEVLRLSELFSTNDLVAYLDRATGGALHRKMGEVCQRLNMQDSTFPSVHGMSVAEGGQRVDCRSTGGEMIHALRVLDKLHPEFAPYVQQIVFNPANTRLASLRAGGLRPRSQYIEGPDTGSSRVMLAAAPHIDETGRDLDAAYDPRADVQVASAEGAVEAADSEQAGGGDDESGAEDDDADDEPVSGIRGVRMMKTGQLGTETTRVGRGRRRRTVMLPPHRRTSWRTSLGMATRVIDGIERKIYFWTSNDSATQRHAAIDEALDVGFSTLQSRIRLARATPPSPGEAPLVPAL